MSTLQVCFGVVVEGRRTSTEVGGPRQRWAEADRGGETRLYHDNNDKELLPTSVGLWCAHQVMWCGVVYHPGPLLGLQQCPTQGRKWMEGSLLHEPRSLQATCHVLQTMQLTHYLPDDDEWHPPSLHWSQQSHLLHGWHSHLLCLPHRPSENHLRDTPDPLLLQTISLTREM